MRYQIIQWVSKKIHAMMSWVSRIDNIFAFESKPFEFRWVAKLRIFEKRPQGVRRRMKRITKFLIKPPLDLKSPRNWKFAQNTAFLSDQKWAHTPRIRLEMYHLNTIASHHGLTKIALRFLCWAIVWIFLCVWEIRKFITWKIWIL